MSYSIVNSLLGLPPTDPNYQDRLARNRSAGQAPGISSVLSAPTAVPAVADPSLRTQSTGAPGFMDRWEGVGAAGNLELNKARAAREYPQAGTAEPGISSVIDQGAPAGPVLGETGGLVPQFNNSAALRAGDPLETWKAANPYKLSSAMPADMAQQQQKFAQEQLVQKRQGNEEQRQQSQEQRQQSEHVSHLATFTAAADKAKRDSRALMLAHAAILKGEDPSAAYLGGGGSEASMLSVLKEKKTAAPPEFRNLGKDSEGRPVEGVYSPTTGNFSERPTAKAPRTDPNQPVQMQTTEDGTKFYHDGDSWKPLREGQAPKAPDFTLRVADRPLYDAMRADYLAYQQGRAKTGQPAAAAGGVPKFGADHEGKRMKGPDGKIYRIKNGQPIPE